MASEPSPSTSSTATAAPIPSFNVEEPAPSETGEEQPGLGRKVLSGVGRIGYSIFDNMSFVGEVIVSFLELDKPKYHKELEELQRQKRQQARLKREKEEAEIARLEDPPEVDAAAPQT
eukprot:TRINITY_DN55305_c0_g1_i1.p1 TRINITY_DN55305_c0_g1~~TRINITY_DN55305_c0_g1_i1.p1  ORF type:complete len:118 (-),score=29.49 TRINITY_DN55305_c0_g1_i1:206-559(-)